MFEGDTEAEDSGGEEEERYERREARWSNKATNKMHLQIKACYCCLIGQLTWSYQSTDFHNRNKQLQAKAVPRKWQREFLPHFDTLH